MQLATTTKIRVRPTGRALGAAVVGADLGDLQGDDFQLIREAL